MRNICLVIVGAVIALSACSKSKIDQASADTEDFKTRMCACADKDCAEKVQTEFKEWRHKLKDSISKEEAKNLSKETQKKLEESFEEFEKCSKKARGGGDDGDGKSAAAMTKMTEFKDKMCACKDKACADGVQKDMMAWSTDAMKDAANMKMSPEDTKKMTDVAKGMSDCMVAAMAH